MNFTCTGRIVKWRAAGELPAQTSDENDNTKLRIWRRVENSPGFYSRTQLTIALGLCNNGRIADTIATNVHECRLNNNLQVPVQAGDIIGMEIPLSRRRVFTPYFDTETGPTNYDLFNLTASEVSLSDTVATITQAQPLLLLTVIATDTEVTTTTDSVLTLVTTEHPVFIDTTTTGQELPVQPSRTLTPLSASVGIGRENFSPKYTASIVYHDVTNNVTMVDSDDEFAFKVSIMTAAVFGGIALMAVVIVILTLALVCSVRKNRKLKREMTMKDCRMRNLGDNMNSSMELILSDSSTGGASHVILNDDSMGADHVTSTGHVTSDIPMKENIAYNQQRRSDGYEYVENELVYASINRPVGPAT